MLRAAMDPRRGTGVRSWDTRHFRLPREAWWEAELADTTLAIELLELVTCEVTTEDGATGLGYTYTLGRGGAAVHAMLATEIAAELPGVDCRQAERFWLDSWWRLFRVGRGGVVPIALAAADVALYDAASRAAGEPLAAYLGGEPRPVAAYGSGVDLAYDLDDLVEEVTDYRRRGFRAVKVKVGRSLPEDLERLAAVREAIGPGCELMVDANLGWDLAEAARRVHAMERFDLAWVEEPLVPEDVLGHAELQRQTSTPIAVGETLFSPWEFQSYVRAGAARVLQPDVGRVGGITPWLRVAHLAEGAHLRIAPHFLQDLHVQLLGVIPNALLLEYLPWLDRLLQRPLAVADGQAAPHQGPGHGVAFDLELLAPHEVASATGP